MLGNNSHSQLKHAFLVSVGTFFLAIFISFFSELAINKFQNILFAILLLLFIVVIGIIFDMIGMAATAADEAPFHAKAAKKVSGSKQSLRLLGNADKVANFCNDVVGDICGTVSGALGAAIVYEVTRNSGLSTAESAISLIVTGLVAALTVGGKAVGKKFAIDQSEDIIFRVGQLLAQIEHYTGIKLFAKKKRRQREKV